MARAWMKSVGDAFGRLARCTRAGVAVIGALSLTTIVGMGAFVVVGTLTPLADALGTAKADAAIVLTSYAFDYALLSPITATIWRKPSAVHRATISLRSKRPKPRPAASGAR